MPKPAKKARLHNRIPNVKAPSFQPIARGRPGIPYDEKMGDLILEEFAKGQASLRALCEKHGFPDRSVVYRWILESPEFASKFAIAREIAMHGYVDDMVYLVDNAKDIGRAKAQVAARQWMATRLLPRVYGDNINHEHTITPGSPVSTGVYEAMTQEERDHMRAILTSAMRRQQASSEGLVIDQSKQ
jgi:hypothetical protein